MDSYITSKGNFPEPARGQCSRHYVVVVYVYAYKTYLSRQHLRTDVARTLWEQIIAGARCHYTTLDLPVPLNVSIT